MKKATTAFALTGVAMSLLIVYIIALGNARFKSYGRAAARVLDVSGGDITRISIVHPEKADNLVFEKSDGKWALTSPAGIPYEQSLADALPLTLTALTAEKEIVSDSLADFGLENPIVIRIWAKTPDSSAHAHSQGGAPSVPDGDAEIEYELHLGGENSDGSSRYFSTLLPRSGNKKQEFGLWAADAAHVGTDSRIYTMDAATADALALDTRSVRDKNVLRFNRSLKLTDLAAKITDIRVDGESRPDLSDVLARLNADTFLGETDFTASHTIEFSYDGERRTLYLGAQTPDGAYYYAKTADSDMVFTAPGQGLAL